jgi:D-alanyl-lipoteichoic acid acyltransferase DltB (MBOAT superfamily)
VLFNGYPFLFVFLPLALVGWFALRSQPLRLAFAIAASYVFYAYDEWWFPALMLTTTVVAYVSGLGVASATSERTRRLIVAGGVSAVLAQLGFFKYAELLAGNTSSLVATITGRGLPTVEEFASGIVLPIGISFFTFEAISYIVDVYRRDIEPDRNPLRVFFFISFFPHLIAGPIVRYAKLRPQLERFAEFDIERFTSGILLVAVGLVEKVVIADGLATHSDPLLNEPDTLALGTAWTAMVAYSFRIYFDFAAYSDMALGLARLFGIELPWNFDRPYRARSPREFWRRWHVTLSTWLRDYLYIPLGGNRKGPLRRDANVLATMTLGGLWHGASVTFAVWGFYQGVLLVAQNRLERFGLRVPSFLLGVLTFVLVTFGWAFFRMDNPGDVGATLTALVGLAGVDSPARSLLPYIAVSATLVYATPEAWSWRFERWGAVRVAAVGACAALALILLNDTQRFIYFRF